LLEAALAGLSGQKTSRLWEVLVVDNGSEDGTAQTVREAAPGFPVPLRFTQERIQGLSSARNRGLSVSRAGVVLFLDDDAVCLPGWLEAHGRAFDDPAVAATGGRILPVFPAETSPFMRDLLLSECGGPGAYYDLGDEPVVIEEGSAHPLPFGANMGFRRAAALEQGGFRTDLGWGGTRWVVGEETDLLGRLRGMGGRVVYVPDACVEHRLTPEKTTFRYWREYQTAYGRSLEIMASHRTLFRGLLRSVKYAWKVLRYSVLLRIRKDERVSLSRKRARARGRLDVLLSGRFGGRWKRIRHEPS
jgi:glycosyltransferase involved in cell wall biosynthesis